MNILTQRQAEECATPEVYGIIGVDDLTIAISVIELAFELFKAMPCSHNLTPNLLLSAQPASEGQFDPVIFRKAKRGTKRSLRHHQLSTDDRTVDALTKHMLTHITKQPTDMVAACCAEAPDQSISIEGIDE